MNGLDLLGGADSDWKWRESAKIWRQGYALGIFDGKETFGEAVPAIREFLRQLQDLGRDPRIWCPAIRIHACWNEHGLINPQVLRERCKEYQKKLIAIYPEIKWYISHTCEYSRRASRKELSERIKIIKKECPDAIPVQSPEPGALTLKEYTVEHHGTHAKVRKHGIASTDGQAIFDLDARAWINKNANGAIVFAWGPRCNLSEAGPRILPPHRRTAAPEPAYLESLNRLFDPPPPQTCPHIRLCAN